MAEQKALAVTGSLDVVVVTPRGEVTHRSADEVTARGALGEFGVLPGHIPFLTMLETGVLILDGRAGREIWAHGPGYLEVAAGGRVDILVEQAVPPAEVSTAEVGAELEAIERELKSFDGSDGTEWRNLMARHAWARARLEAGLRSHPPTA